MNITKVIFLYLIPYILLSMEFFVLNGDSSIKDRLIKAITQLNVEECFEILLKNDIDLNSIKIEDEETAFDYIFNKIKNKLFVALSKKKSIDEILDLKELKIAALIKYCYKIKTIYGIYEEKQAVIIPDIYIKKVLDLAKRTVLKIIKKQKPLNYIITY